MTLYYRYGVHAIWGVPFGYQGLVERFGHEWIRLEPSTVSTIHRFGGTMLASSRGYQEAAEMLKLLVRRRVDVLFVIGGDGTIRGALQVAQEAAKQGVRLSVIGVPKTIDNDILHIDQSFGFETAFSEAVESISCAHTEALGAPNGIGLVKLMGRHSGFIACYAALARNDANFVLIPECPFELDGEHGLLAALKARLARRGHAVILAAEGAGQDLMEGGPLGRDASGNVKLKDIGPFLKERILDYFEKQGTEVNLKYIDPSYIIRSVPASPQDSVYCLRLADSAVHAAMSGRTEMVVGRRHGYYVHLPMKLIAAGRRRVDPSGDLWMSVLEATGQPASMKSRAGAK
jgi:6-phosphofructokinase 1